MRSSAVVDRRVPLLADRLVPRHDAQPRLDQPGQQLADLVGRALEDRLDDVVLLAGGPRGQDLHLVRSRTGPRRERVADLLRRDGRAAVLQDLVQRRPRQLSGLGRLRDPSPPSWGEQRVVAPDLIRPRVRRGGHEQRVGVVAVVQQHRAQLAGRAGQERQVVHVSRQLPRSRPGPSPCASRARRAAAAPAPSAGRATDRRTSGCRASRRPDPAGAWRSCTAGPRGRRPARCPRPTPRTTASPASCRSGGPRRTSPPGSGRRSRGGSRPPRQLLLLAGVRRPERLLRQAPRDMWCVSQRYHVYGAKWHALRASSPM